MTNRVCRAFVIGLAAAALAWAAEPPQQDPAAEELDRMFKAAEERMKAADEQMFEHLKHLPSKLDFPFEKERIQVLAADTGEVGAVEVVQVPGSERLPLADGQPSPVEVGRLEISGQAPFYAVHVYLVRLQILTWRYAELESLLLQVREGGTVGFTARVAYPSYTDWPEEGPLSRKPWQSTGDVLVDVVRKKEMALALLQELAARSRVDRVADALVVFGNQMEERAIALTELRFEGGKAVIQGVTLGASARDGLRPALEKAGFVVEDVRLAPAGSCRTFTVTAGLTPAERSDEFASAANGLFEQGTASYCEPSSPAGRVVTAGARGAAAAAGGLTMRLRGVEMIEVFQLLHEATSASFLLDGDVEGTISLDAESATLEEVLAAMGSAGLAVGPGPVRRVTRAGRQPAAAAPADYCAELMDMRVRNASLTEVLCTFNRVAERPILAPPDLQGTVSLYGSDLRVDQVLEALAAANGLVTVVDGDRLLLGRGTADEIRGRTDAMDVCEIRDSPSGSSRYSRLSSLSPSLDQLAAGDLELAGLVRQGETWTAWAFTPTRKLRTLKAGDQLLGASVSVVGPDGVILATEPAGTVKLELRP